MKRIVSVAFIFFIISVSFLQPAPAASQQAASSQKSQVLCPPGVYPQGAADCSPLGPSAYLTRMAGLGYTFPPRPLSAVPVDPSLSYIPYQYAVMQEGSAAIYPTLEAAASKSSAVGTIGEGRLKYISYIDRQEYNGELYYELRSGGWVSASEGVASRVSIYNNFRGLVIDGIPSNSFGWVLPFDINTETKRTPGHQGQDYTGHKIPQYALVQVYAVKKVGDVDWLMVGPDEWADGTKIGRVIPNPKPPEGVTNGRWIEVNLEQQTLAAYDQYRMVFATLIISGMPPFWTAPGLFQIYKKLDSTPMSGSFETDRSDFYYLEDVPYTMYYDGARALHGAYWRSRFGFPQSHGCINLAVADAHWLFGWAQQGDWVYVWDPSGKTPTDPKQYQGSGAP